MLEVHLEGVTRIDAIGRKLKAATAKKMTELTEMLYEKVVENLSGKVLEKQTGALLASVHKSVSISDDEYEGMVFVSPETTKAWVLEKGGSGYYPIVPVKASVLHWISKSGEEMFAKSVSHPPSKEFAYLRLALEEMEALVPEGFRDAIQLSFEGGAYE